MFCLADGCLSCADGLFVRFKSSFRFISTAIAAHFKIVFLFSKRESPRPAGGVKRGTGTHGSYPSYPLWATASLRWLWAGTCASCTPLNNLPQSPFKLPSADFFCPAEQVPMQCSPPMPFITTYVCFNCCRLVFMYVS